MKSQNKALEPVPTSGRGPAQAHSCSSQALTARWEARSTRA